MKLTFQLAFLSLTNLVLGFLLQTLVLVQIGPGAESDALFAGMTIPQFVLTIVGGTLAHVLVPLLSGERDDRLWEDAWSCIILVGGFFGLVAIALYTTAPTWVPLMVPGFDRSTHVLTVELTRIQLIGMLFIGINGVQWSVLQAQGRFLWVESISILTGCVALALLVWALPRYGVVGAAWITTGRVGVQTLLLVSTMKLPARLIVYSPAVREAWRRLKPLLLGAAYYKSDPLVDRFLLSMSGSGSLSVYYFAQQVYAVGSQVLNRAVVVPLVPTLSRLHKGGEQALFEQQAKRTATQLAVISIAGVLVLAVFGPPLSAIAGNVGEVSLQDLSLLLSMMLLMAGQFIFGSVGMVLASMFYALGDTRSPTAVGILAYTLGIGIKVIAFHWGGALGLALGASIYYAVAFLLLLQRIRRRTPAASSA